MTQSNDKKRFLLIGGRSTSTLDLARQLHYAGHDVLTTDTLTWSTSSFSNAVVKSFKTPSPRFATEAFIDRLIDIVQTEKIDLVIPTYEEILYLAQYRNRFPDPSKLFTTSLEEIHQLHNKWLFYQRQKKHGIPAPKAQLVESLSDLNKLNFSGRYVLKACYSRASQSLYIVEPKKSPPRISIKPHNPWIAQEWLEGKRYCTYSICQQGKVCAHAVYPVQFAIDSNSCINFTAVDHPGILKWVQNFAALENFTGQFGFDFFEMADGTLYAIECNPRATNGLLLFRPEDRIDRAFLNKTDKLITPPPGTSKQIAFGMLLYGWQDAYKNKKVRDYISTLFGTQDVVLSLRDIKPFFSQPLIFASYMYQSKKAGLSLPAWFTNDFNWDGEAT